MNMVVIETSSFIVLLWLSTRAFALCEVVSVVAAQKRSEVAAGGSSLF
jgi:hypothetical protein